MMHPSAELRFVSPSIGYGVFATRSISMGTLTYVLDPLDVLLSPAAYERLPEVLRDHVDRYSSIEPNGTRIVSWDLAKYVNHCCNCNTMSSGYGFEIAIRDIAAGEQITDEYGLFNLPDELPISCDGATDCRGFLRPEDIDVHNRRWDDLVRDALRRFREVDQPLAPLLDRTTLAEIDAFLSDNARYRSVRELRRSRPGLA